MLFVVPHAYRADTGPRPLPLDRIVDITDAVHAGKVRHIPALPPAVIAVYGPAADPLTIPDGLTLDEQRRHVLAAILTPRPISYADITDNAIPAQVHTWLAEDPDCLIVLTWTDHDNGYESLLTPGRETRVHLVVRQVQPELLAGGNRAGPGDRGAAIT